VLPKAIRPVAAEDTLSRYLVRLSSSIGVTVGALAFFLTLFDYARDPLRGATAVRYAESFFELQAEAIREGHLWVPDGSLGIEGFVVNGHTYSYFGIFPALLRMPVQFVTHEYDGRLTLLSMALAWVVFAVMSTRLFWLIREAMGRPAMTGRLDTVLAAIFIAVATGGTAITFDASLPWVYHEVYLWSIASVVGALYWLLRVLSGPAPTSIRWLFAFALISALTRTTGGWAVCLVTIAAAVWLATGRPRPRDRRTWVSLLAAGLVPLLAGVVINYLKFRHPYMFPLQDQVWTELNAHRAEVLNENGGTLAGLQFFPSSLVNYFRPDGIRFVEYFPWVTFPSEPARGYGAVLDQSYRTGSVTAFMPLMLALTVISVPVLFRPLPTAQYRAVRLVWLGALLVTGGVMAYGYIAYRYTSEFVPVMIVGSAVAMHAISGWLHRHGRAIRAGVVGVLVVSAAFSIVIHMLVGYSAAAATYKGPRLEAYLDHQVRLSGSTAAFRGLVHHSGGMPTGGKPDDLWIRGDCEALYFNNGEEGDPWTLVQERDTAVRVRVGDDPVLGNYLLMENNEQKTSRISIRLAPDRQAQLILDIDGTVSRGLLFDLPPNAEIRVGARNLSELGAAEISSTPGGFVGYLPTAQWDENQQPVLSSVVAASERPAPGDGLTVTPASTLQLTLCQRIAEAADVQTSVAN
jgi:hypothetical protein